MAAYRMQGMGIHFLTCTIVNWIDVFTRSRYCEILVDSLAYCKDSKGLKVHAYVIMSNHIHLLVSSEKKELSDVIRDFKQFTSRQIAKSIENDPESRRDWILAILEQNAQIHRKVKHRQFWQEGSHAIVCFSHDFIMQKLNYIHQNPVKARYVYRAEDYVWSSAQDYAGMQGPLKVDLLS